MNAIRVPGMAFHAERRKKLAEKMPDGSVALVHSNDLMPRSGDQFFPFRQHPDLYYLTGITQEKTILCICPRHHDPGKREILFILRPTPELETWEGRKLDETGAREISGISNIAWTDEFESVFRDLVLDCSTVYINSNDYAKFKTEIKSPDARFYDWFSTSYPLHRTERLAPLLAQLRLVKQPVEIALLKKAAQITAGAFHRILGFVEPGVYEYQIEAEIMHEFTSAGSDGHAFLPIIASGANACVLHYTRNRARCRHGDLLLLDFGADLHHYAADCSRTIPVNGRFTKEQKKYYLAVLALFREAFQSLQPGKSLSDINRQVHEMSVRIHVDLGLYSRKEMKSEAGKLLKQKYFPHGVSHFIGLDVHDVGDKDAVLQPGMVLSCEPGLYHGGKGIGIRIENMVLITGQGPEDLMAGIPLAPEELETLMTKNR